MPQRSACCAFSLDEAYHAKHLFRLVAQSQEQPSAPSADWVAAKVHLDGLRRLVVIATKQQRRVHAGGVAGYQPCAVCRELLDARQGK